MKERTTARGGTTVSRDPMVDTGGRGMMASHGPYQRAKGPKCSARLMQQATIFSTG